MSKNSIILFLKDYLIKYLTRPILLDTNEVLQNIYVNNVNSKLFRIKSIARH